MEELLATINAINEKDNENRKFFAAINGIDIDSEPSENDIVDLKGHAAANEGFGIGLGLGYVVEGG